MHTTLFWGEGGGGLPFFGVYFGDGPIKVAYCKTNQITKALGCTMTK